MRPDWRAARAALDALDLKADALEQARAYVARWPRHPPDSFRFTTRQRRAAAARALGDGDGWLSRLAMSCPRLTLYTLDYRALRLDRSDSDPAKIYDRATLAKWKRAIARTFAGYPHRAKLESGSSIHAHILADAACCPQTVRLGSERAKICDDQLERLSGYLSKPATRYTAESLATWLRARRSLARLPRLVWQSGIPRNLPTNRLRIKSPSTLPPDPAEPDPEPQPDAHTGTSPEATRAPLRPRRVSPHLLGLKSLILGTQATTPRLKATRQRDRSPEPMRHNERPHARGPPRAPSCFTSESADSTSLTPEMEHHRT